MDLNPLVDFYDLQSKKHHKIWKFSNKYGISAVKQPPGEDVRGTDGTTWSVAVIKFFGPEIDQFEVDYNNSLCREQGDLFTFVPDEQLDAIVLLASRMECQDFS
jgi:hypothetical protein